VCLLSIAINGDPQWPLLLVANRDEFHARPTAPLAPWPDQPILGGRDLQAGGSWMALGDNNRFALVTNYRDARRPPPADAPSRGTLVTEFIRSGQSAQAFCQSLVTPRAGFNLLLADGHGIWHYSNISGLCQPVGPGVHGLSNALLDTPWPKVVRARTALTRAIRTRALNEIDLLHLLHDEQRPEDAALPDTGVGLERERLLAPCFIRSPEYGTRASTLLLQHRSGRLLFLEEGYDRDGRAISRRRYSLDRPLLVPADPGGGAGSTAPGRAV
jgi:uncharacterized protein with NRDE domain